MRRYHSNVPPIHETAHQFPEKYIWKLPQGALGYGKWFQECIKIDKRKKQIRKERYAAYRKTVDEPMGYRDYFKYNQMMLKMGLETI